MSKKSKLVVWSVVGLAILLIFVVVLLFYKKSPVDVIKKSAIGYYISPEISDSDKSVLAKAIQESLASADLRPSSDANGANIIIQTKAGEGYEVLATENTPAPQKLTGPIVVSTAQNPKYYIKILSPIDSSVINRIKEKISNNLSKPTQWTMKIAGDIIIGRTVYEQEMRRNDYTSSFALVKDYLQNADYTVADAEWTAADGIPHPLVGMSFSSPTKSLEGLSYAGIDAVSLANNHSMNGGVAAFEQMLDSLTARKIGYFGAGRNYNKAHEPYIADIKGVKVAFLGYTSIPGNFEAGTSSTGNAFIKISPWYPFNESDVAQMENDIKLAKSKADVVLPYFHWSQEYVHQPNDQMRAVAHRAIDAGATMVVGSHPHWVQGLEWYKDSLIAYSLGNFVFDQEQSLKTKQGVVLSTEFSGNKLVKADLVPIQIEQYFQPHILQGSASQDVLNNIFGSSYWAN